MDKYIIKSPALQCKTLSANASTTDDSDDVTISCNDEEMHTTPKRIKYAQQYKHKWESDFPWLKNESNIAFCKLCKKSLDNNYTHLKRHAKAQSHVKGEAQEVIACSHQSLLRDLAR